MKSSATCALAIMKSISPRYFAPERRSGIYGLRNSVNSKRMRWISLCSENLSSLIWLSSSTTSAGSMKAVFPVADSSYMKPAIFFLFAALTGISILPSRTETPASESTIPSSCAFLRIALIRREIAPSFSLSDFLISYSSSDAVSLTSPYLSMIPSIFLCTSGKFMMWDDIRLRLG